MAREGVLITTTSGRRLISTPEHVHFAAHEHHLPGGVTITLCGARGGGHLVSGAGHSCAIDDYGRALALAESFNAGRSSPVQQLVRTQAGSLPFMAAEAMQPGMSMFAEDGGFDVVDSVERIPLAAPVYDIDVEGTHSFIANGLLTHNSIYRFRGADIENILGFERDYPDAQVVKLEQNYRSTQTILNASNAVISNNRQRKDKFLWSDIGEGDPVQVRELEDEHAEARFVVSEIERLVEEGESRDEVAVFYRTNAQSVCSRTCWSATASATRSSAARASTSAPRSRMRSPI